MIKTREKERGDEKINIYFGHAGGPYNTYAFQISLCVIDLLSFIYLCDVIWFGKIERGQKVVTIRHPFVAPVASFKIDSETRDLYPKSLVRHFYRL